MQWNVPQWVCLAIAGCGATTDLIHRRIPNRLTMPAIILALVYQGIVRGWIDGVMFAITGVAAGCAFLMVPFVMGVMGGGDVKLLGAMGAWLGSHSIFYVFCYAAIAGGCMALVILVRSKRFRLSLKRMVRGIPFIYLFYRHRPLSDSKQQMPYAVAIFIGHVIFMHCGRLI